MISSVNVMEGWRVQGRDGDLGTLTDFYFDDERWGIRYLIVRTGDWLNGREVLVSPVFAGHANTWDGAFRVELTQAQIQAAPDIDTRRPVSRQLESELSSYYEYPPYWALGAGSTLWGWGPMPTSAIDARLHKDMVDRDRRARGASKLGGRVDDKAHDEVGARIHDRADDWAEGVRMGHHLRSARDLIGYQVEARDGSVGHVEDILFDESTWAIRHIALDTRNWLPGKRIVIGPQHFTDVRWPDRKVQLDLTREQIRRSREFEAVAIDQRMTPEKAAQMTAAKG